MPPDSRPELKISRGAFVNIRFGYELEATVNKPKYGNKEFVLEFEGVVMRFPEKDRDFINGSTEK